MLKVYIKFWSGWCIEHSAQFAEFFELQRPKWHKMLQRDLLKNKRSHQRKQETRYSRIGFKNL